MSVLAISARVDSLGDFLEAVGGGIEMKMMTAASAKEALDVIKAETPGFVILDKELPDMEPMDLAMEILKINAMVNMAAITTMSDEEYHEASEGLGILCAVAPNPVAADGDKLAEVFKRFV